MLASKLVTIAAAITLALPSTTAVEQSTHLRVHVHHHHKGPCSGPGQSPMSVEGVAGVFCVSGQACVANIHGACPGPQPGLEWGSACGTVASGVQGCKVNTSAPEEEPPVDEEDSWELEDAPANPCSGEDESPMSVEGVEQIFCVSGQACVANIKDGACPGPQEGLPWGSSCGKVKTGVYGCKPNQGEEEEEERAQSEDTETEGSQEEEAGTWDGDVDIDIEIDTDNSCWSDETPMSVEGLKQIFCVSGQACVAHIKDGACPGPQEGLQWGSSCTKIKTGVYGCTPNSGEEEEASEEDATIVEDDAANEEEGSKDEAASQGDEETAENEEEDDAAMKEEEPAEGEEEEEPADDEEDAAKEGETAEGEEEQGVVGEGEEEQGEAAEGEEEQGEAAEGEEGEEEQGEAAEGEEEQGGAAEGEEEQAEGEEGEEEQGEAAEGEEEQAEGEEEEATEGATPSSDAPQRHHHHHKKAIKKVHHKKHHKH